MYTHYLPPIDADYEVKPGFEGNLLVVVAEDLEAEAAVRASRLWSRSVVKPRDETIQSSEHAHVWSVQVIEGPVLGMANAERFEFEGCVCSSEAMRGDNSVASSRESLLEYRSVMIV